MEQISIAVVVNNALELALLSDYIREGFADSEMNPLIQGFLDPRKAYDYMVNSDCGLLFIGVSLCGGDGLLLSRRIQEYRPDVSIVLVTEQEEYVLQALQMYIHLRGYLSMPTSVEAVKMLLDSIYSPNVGAFFHEKRRFRPTNLYGSLQSLGV